MPSLFDYLKIEIQSEDVSKSLPRYPRFEVENVTTRKNFVFALEDKAVNCYDTSREAFNWKREPLSSYWEDEFSEPFPFNCKTAEEYYKTLYQKALSFQDNVMFLGYVDENFNPIEEEPIEPSDEEITNRIEEDDACPF